MAAKVVKEFKEFEKMFRRVIRPRSYEARKEGQRTLTPQMFKKLESGRLKPKEIAKLLGKGPDGTQFTLEDLRKFNEAKVKKQKEFNPSVSGSPVAQLLGASWTKDLERARKGIKTATLYRVSGDLLHFRTSSETKPGTYHQVRVRLEEWKENLTGGKDCISSVRRAATGRISLDCDCGRYQYWFRYMATIGGYALTPFEYAFPKIRNPGLGGALCKHSIRVLLQLQAPLTHNFLAKEMQRQSEAVGFGGDKSKTKFLTKAEMEKLEKVGEVNVPTHDALEKEWKAFKKAQKVYQEKLKDKGTRKVLAELRQEKEGREVERAKRIAAETVAKKEIKARKALEEIVRAQQETIKRTAMAGTLKGLAMVSKLPGQMSFENMVDAMIKGGAGVTKDEAMTIAKEEGLI